MGGKHDKPSFYGKSFMTTDPLNGSVCFIFSVHPDNIRQNTRNIPVANDVTRHIFISIRKQTVSAIYM